MMHKILRALVVVLLAFPLFANPFTARDLVIPVIGRTAGAFGSDWRTDVVVTNLDNTSATLSLIFSGADDFALHMVEIRASETIVFEDVLKTSFRREQTLGWLRVSTPRAGAKLTAYARIHNTNATRGESSQIAPGIPVVMSGRDVILSGVNALGEQRTNIGFGSTEGAFDVTITMRAADGSQVAQRSASVGETGFQQINNIFAWLGVAPMEGASIQLASETPIFGYASVVRNDTGDSYLLAGAARDRAVNDVITPACDEPALLNLAVYPAPGYFVLFDDGTDVTARTKVLQEQYGIEVTELSLGISAIFVRSLSPETIAALRCENDVRAIEQNAYAEFAGASSPQPRF